MIRKFTISSIFICLFTIKISNAQETQPSLMEEISYVYMEKLVAVAKENYPRVKALNTRVTIAETSIKTAKLGWLSPLSLSYVYSPTTTLNLANPTFFSGYQIGFSLSLRSLLQTPVDVKRTKEELKIARYDVDEYLASLTTDVKTRYTTYILAVRALKNTSQAYLDARDLYTLTKYRYERGELAITDFIAISSAMNSSNQAKIDAEVGVLQAKFALEELLGIKLEEVPN